VSSPGAKLLRDAISACRDGLGATNDLMKNVGCRSYLCPPATLRRISDAKCAYRTSETTAYSRYRQLSRKYLVLRWHL